MAIYEISSDKFRKIDETSFSSAGVRERQDLQRLLRTQIEIISSDILVISEEFSQWEDSKRRIDLLGIDREANLVVIELKRTDDGGHMDLQSLRYAAMISPMTFNQAVDVYAEFLKRNGRSDDAQTSILEFLDWETSAKGTFAKDVRIILVSAEFAKEVTTTVIWLNQFKLNIKCIRFKPYRDGERLLVDVQQIIPLPEAEDYQVRLQEKQQSERTARVTNRDHTKYDITVNGLIHTALSKRTAIFTVVQHLAKSEYSPDAMCSAVTWHPSLFRVADGELPAVEFISALQAAAASGGRGFDESRYFCLSDSELIHSSGKTYALTNQWGQQTIRAIEDLIAAFPAAKISCQTSEEAV